MRDWTAGSGYMYCCSVDFSLEAVKICYSKCVIHIAEDYVCTFVYAK